MVPSSKCAVRTLFTLLVLCCAAVDARPWTDSTGKRTVEAEFVSLADGKVTLKKADGKTVTMALDKLSAADQKAAKELAEKETPAGNTSEPKVALTSLTISRPYEEPYGIVSFAPTVNGGGTSLTFLVPYPASFFRP